ncbi:MAG TPA: VWA domain-containing protein [Vicinamibacteria bacterium]|nr:VWA domain-containing protein [Vicinamibacteria bacterium]
MQPRPASALALATLAALATAGTSPAVGAGQQPPVFGTAVELVRLDVVVLDKDGRPVTGLSRDDFVVEEEGRLQRVDSFEPVVVAAARPRTPDEPPRLTGARLRAPSEGRCFLLFVDDVHLAPPTMERVRVSLRRFLETDVREGDWVTLVAPEQELWWTARSAWEYRQLAAVVGRLAGQGRGDDYGDWVAVRAVEYGLPPVGGRSAVMAGGSGTSGGPGQFAVVGRADAPVFTEEVVQQIKRRTGITLGGLQQALESLVRLRGQKSLVLVSAGFLLLPKMPGYEEAIDLARRANVAIHYVDPRGLQTGTSSEEGGAQARSGVAGTVMPGTMIALARGDTEGIAEVTGGTVFDGNDTEAGLRRVAERSDAYYLLGYQPDRPGTGERKVSVRVAREGLRVRGRSLYYVPEPAKAAKAAAPPLLASLPAMRSLADTTDLPVRTATLYFEANRKGEVATMLATEVVPPPGRKGERLFKLVSEARARDGGPPVRDEFEGSPDVTPGVPVVLARQWHLTPGVWQVRLLVEDTTTGRLGTVLHTFEVPDPKTFRLSTPILTAELEDPNGRRKPKVALGRTFRTGTTLYCQYNVYGATGGGRHDWAPHVLGAWTLRRGDEVVRESPPTLIQPGGDGRLTRTLGISLQGASPGEYALVLAVKDEKTGETHSVAEAFTVVP